MRTVIAFNAFSIFDLLAAIITANIALIFIYRFVRRKRMETDLSFLLTILLALGISLLILVVDNVVPAGIPARAVPNASTRTVLCYRLTYAVGFFLMASLVHFTLRYCRIPRLDGRRVGWLYLAAAIAGSIVWSDDFFRARAHPLAETSSWHCTVPWAPAPGFLTAFYLLLAIVMSVLLPYFLWWRPHEEAASGLIELRMNVVRLGILAMCLSWLPGVLMTVCKYAGVDVSVIVLTVGMVAVAFGLAEEHTREEREREHVTRRFRSYVDPALVKYVIEHPESERIVSEVRELTVVFTDLEGFTMISEKLREGVVELVNEYLKLMTPLIRNHNGYRDKFLGDGMKFFYGAPERNPDHAIHAVATVLKMEEMMMELNRYITADERGIFAGLPKLVMRAGVSTGQMVVGDAGTAEASDYTVLGDTVNLGSRLETANKATGTHILLSERTVELLPKDLFLVRPIARLRVVGKKVSVMTYEPVAFVKDATAAQLRCAELTHAMVDCFQRSRFAECLEAESRLEQAMGASKLGKVYREQSVGYLANPPGPDFTGEIVLTEK